MIGSFKNFERLRYRLSSDIQKTVSDSKKNTHEMKEQISNTIFATIFSAFVTEVAFADICTEFSLKRIALQLLLFIVIYIGSYYLYNKSWNKVIELRERSKKHHVNESTGAMLQIQKDFDNIACDSILVANGYKKEFCFLEEGEAEGTVSNESFKTFYYYEIMHYLDTACDKALSLVENKDRCIRTMDKAVGVDIFRVLNIIKIMDELNAFLTEKYGIICGDAEQKDAIDYQRGEITTKITNIKKKLN